MKKGDKVYQYCMRHEVIANTVVERKLALKEITVDMISLSKGERVLVAPLQDLQFEAHAICKEADVDTGKFVGGSLFFSNKQDEFIMLNLMQNKIVEDIQFEESQHFKRIESLKKDLSLANNGSFKLVEVV